MALDFDAPPIYDPITREPMSSVWSAHQTAAWQTLTTYLSSGGIFIPQVTTAQRDKMMTVMDGQMIYNTDLKKAQLREDGTWKTFITV